MSQIHDDLGAALDAYRGAFPGSKPRVTISYNEKEVQLLLHEPENPSHLRPTGYASQKTLEEAAVALRRNYSRHLRELAEKEDAKLAANITNHSAHIARLRTFSMTVNVPEPEGA